MHEGSFAVGGLVHHHCVEVFSGDVAGVVHIHFLEDLINFLIGQVLSQFSSHHLELLGVDFSLSYVIFTLLSKSKDLKTSYISSWE